MYQGISSKRRTDRRQDAQIFDLRSQIAQLTAGSGGGGGNFEAVQPFTAGVYRDEGRGREDEQEDGDDVIARALDLLPPFIAFLGIQKQKVDFAKFKLQVDGLGSTGDPTGAMRGLAAAFQNNLNTQSLVNIIEIGAKAWEFMTEDTDSDMEGPDHTLTFLVLAIGGWWVLKQSGVIA